LKKKRLTTKDYMDEGEKRRNKGKYGVTIPKPFGFDLREKNRSKSIRERKVEEMVEEKRIEVERIVKH
jgi:hypothetical protein